MSRVCTCAPTHTEKSSLLRRTEWSWYLSLPSTSLGPDRFLGRNRHGSTGDGPTLIKFKSLFSQGPCALTVLEKLE